MLSLASVDRPALDPKSVEPTSFESYAQKMRDFFDEFAKVRKDWRPAGYHDLVARYYQFYITPGAKILEIGCGQGQLLAALEPSLGVGIDISPEMIARAKGLHPDEPHLQFHCQPAESLSLPDQDFDYIILSDTLSYVYDIEMVLRQVKRYCRPHTRVITNFYSRLWQPILSTLEWLGLKYPQPLLNWVTPPDVKNLLEVCGFEVVQYDLRMLLPANVPVLGDLLNRFLGSLPGIRHFCLSNWFVARVPSPMPADVGVSVICPCRNEAGNIQSIVDRFPDFGIPAELVFVEGNSKDGTLAECHRVAQATTDKEISVFQQKGKGKGDAVRLGFDQAKYDILVILDADMTVPPEDLPRFVKVLREGRGEFINGSRLVYAMEGQAMRFLNLLGNKFFSVLISYLLGQSLKDTLCGTKVISRSNYRRLVRQRSYFGDFDPFGDFDLLFGAAKLSLRIVDFPIRYRARTYGETQISRFTHGWMLLKMCAFAMLKLRCR